MIKGQKRWMNHADMKPNPDETKTALGPKTQFDKRIRNNHSFSS